MSRVPVRHREPAARFLDFKHRKLLALALGLLGFFAAANACRAEVDEGVLQAETERVAVLEKARAATLAIFSPGGQNGGSGVVVSPDGFALTNFHVTSGAGNAMKCGMADGELYDAVIVGIDPTGDVSLIKLFGREDFPYAELGDSDQMRAGDWAFAVGNPFLLATDFKPTVSYGIVSGVHRYQYPSGTLLEYADCIQTDAAINPGNSGGPLFNVQGQVVGINGRGSFEKRGRVSVGVGYAISINQIKNFMGSLKSGRIVDHATLGARVAVDEEHRVVVSEILDDSDAWRRGLRYGDEIVTLAGRTIRTPNGFQNAMGIFPKGWRVPLQFRRDGKTFDVLVRLQGVHGTNELAALLEGKPVEEPGPPPDGKRPKPDQPKPDQPAPDQGQPDQGQPDQGQPGQPQPDKPDGKPNRPSALRGPQPKPMPEIVKQHFEARPGYANYYFNKQAQERIGKGLSALGAFANAPGKWTFRGEVEGGGTARFELENGRCFSALPLGESSVAVGDDLAESLAPPASGGLLAALYEWRRLLMEGIDRFGGIYYLGAFPLDGQLADVLAGTDRGVECRFYFDPTDGRLAAMEMFPDESSDPCEVYFADYGDFGGRLFPRRMTVRYGNDLYGSFRLTDYNLEAPAEK